MKLQKFQQSIWIPYKNINKSIKNNQHILFDIDWKGARKIRRNYNKENILDFFILPPSKSELKRRLKKGEEIIIRKLI